MVFFSWATFKTFFMCVFFSFFVHNQNLNSFVVIPRPVSIGLTLTQLVHCPLGVSKSMSSSSVCLRVWPDQPLGSVSVSPANGVRCNEAQRSRPEGKGGRRALRMVTAS